MSVNSKAVFCTVILSTIILKSSSSNSVNIFGSLSMLSISILKRIAVIIGNIAISIIGELIDRYDDKAKKEEEE